MTVDPVEFGAMQAEMRAVRRELDEMHNDLKLLLELVNRSRGAFWLGAGVASAFSAVVAFFANKVLG